MSRQKDNVDKGGKAYIDTLPKREQERLPGVHGRNLVNKGFLSWSEKARGISHDGFKARVPVPESLKAYVKNGKVNVGKLGKRLEGEAVDDVIKRVKDYINSPFFMANTFHGKECTQKGISYISPKIIKAIMSMKSLMQM